MATGQTDKVIEIRPVLTLEENRKAVALQKTIWGFDEVDLLPARLFVTAGKVGGQVFGAYHVKPGATAMVGFCLAIPGLKPGGRFYLHSHMLGVLPAYRDCGIGRKLKMRQREDALARGIELMEWTFDPFELKNAYFNIERLGAVVRRYVRNQYGISSSPLHGGLPTDRCIAEWWMKRELTTVAVEARIEVPANIAHIRATEPARAREIQSAMSDRFEAAFDRGLAVIGFENSEASGTYLLGKWNEDR